MKIGPDDLHLAKKAGAGAPGHEPARDPELETALAQALRPVDAPHGFADRLMRRALAEERPGAHEVSSPALVATARKPTSKLLHWPQSRLWVTGAVAAGLVAGVLEGGVALHHMREQQRRVVQATQEFQTTERVTVRALAQAREQLERAGVPLSLD